MVDLGVEVIVVMKNKKIRGDGDPFYTRTLGGCLLVYCFDYLTTYGKVVFISLLYALEA